MQWREDLDEASSDEAHGALRDNMDAVQRELLHECATRIDELHDFPAAVQSVRALMFIEKFGHDLDLAFDKQET